MSEQDPRPDWERAGIPHKYADVAIDLETFKVAYGEEKISNVPFRRSRVGPIRFNPVKYAKKTKNPEEAAPEFSRDQQKRKLLSLLTEDEIYKSTSRILIAHPKTDKIPMTIASCIAKPWLLKTRKVIFLNPFFLSGKVRFKENKSEFIFGAYDLVCIYGVSGNSTDYRIQEVRDLISAVTWKCPVMVIAGGISDPIEFYQDKLNLEMDTILFVSDTIQI